MMEGVGRPESLEAPRLGWERMRHTEDAPGETAGQRGEEVREGVVALQGDGGRMGRSGWPTHPLDDGINLNHNLNRNNSLNFKSES